ncbi:hypothetical protein, partial [Mycoplasmopsis gallopavonis]|uniref:hypothetical protein n=1 Tax=Mycoplasmopsis gallopavonis TaxID=76629 RepID=UPI0013EDF09E
QTIINSDQTIRAEFDKIKASQSKTDISKFADKYSEEFDQDIQNQTDFADKKLYTKALIKDLIQYLLVNNTNIHLQNYVMQQFIELWLNTHQLKLRKSQSKLEQDYMKNLLQQIQIKLLIFEQN